MLTSLAPPGREGLAGFGDSVDAPGTTGDGPVERTVEDGKAFRPGYAVRGFGQHGEAALQRVDLMLELVDAACLLRDDERAHVVAQADTPPPKKSRGRVRGGRSDAYRVSGANNAADARSMSADSRSSSGRVPIWRARSFHREKLRSMRLYPMRAGSSPASRNSLTGDSPARYRLRLSRLNDSAYVMRLRVTFATAGRRLRYRTSSALNVPPCFAM